MFRRFWPTKWVYGNRRHWCSFKATINWLIWNDVELVGVQNCYLGFSKFWKFRKFSEKCSIFLFETVSPKSKLKKRNIWEREMSHEYVYKILSRYLKKWLRYNIKHVKNRHFSRHFGTLPCMIFWILFFHRFWRFKKCFRVIFHVLLRNLT